MSEAARRRGLMGNEAEDPNPKFISSTGKPYYKYHTVEPGNTTIPNWLSQMGEMTEMEELTFTGTCKYATSSGNIGTLINGKLVWSSYVPNLKKLVIMPTSTGISGRGFNMGHYAFSGLPKVTEMQLGGLSGDGYCYFNGGGYFRDDNGTKTIGTSAGLHLNVYRTAYDAKGGFANGTKATNTVITCYNKDTGEVLSA